MRAEQNAVVQGSWSLPLAAGLIIFSLQGGCSFGYEFDRALGGTSDDGDGSSATGDGDGDTDLTTGGDGDGSDLGGAPSTGDDETGGRDSGTDPGGGASGGAQHDTGGTGEGEPGTGGETAGGTGGDGSGNSFHPLLVVTTSADEDDPGATPENPGQTGLSLREAIALANTEAGAQAVIFTASGALGLSWALPTITEPLSVTGPAILDFSGSTTSSPCLLVSAADSSLSLVEVRGCKGEPVHIGADAQSAVLSACTLHSNVGSVAVHADDAIVLYNYIQNTSGPSISVFGNGVQVLANLITDSPEAGVMIHTGANDAHVLANLILNAQTGVLIEDATSVSLWHNTIVGSATSGMNLGTATQVDLRNNIVTHSTQFGMVATDAQFAEEDYNLLYQNGSGHCSACTVGPNTLTSDPLFTNPGAMDYSLQPGSPAIDSGIDLGDDRNLASPGLYNGAGPDRGYIEAD
jgi:hypothetical protein